jgi:NTP pyrophosphatase (non-canonical NTP hydrolase)
MAKAKELTEVEPGALITNYAIDRAHEAVRIASGGYSLERIIDHTVEEAAELIQALQKLRRERSAHTHTGVKSELADLLFNVELLAREIGIERKELESRVGGVATRLRDELMT